MSGFDNEVWLDQDIIDRCDDLGIRRVANFDSGKSSSQRSMLDIEHDPVKQAESMKGECAFCLWMGGDIDKLNWTGLADVGHDLNIYRHTYDVKSTGIFGRYLIWPLKKNDLYDGKKFDYLVLVKVGNPICTIARYCSKQVFKDRHQTAWPNHRDLIPGTWFMHERDLEPADRLRQWRRYVPSTHPLYLELRP